MCLALIEKTHEVSSSFISRLIGAQLHRTREMTNFFENYLFNKYRAVYVHGLSDLGINTNPLDILIKIGTKGVFPPRPVLTRAGSMLDLGTDSSSKVVARLRDGLLGFENDQGTSMPFFGSIK